MNNIVYPLKQVLEIKHKRVEEAEKILKEKTQLLEQEKKKLAEKEAERDKVLTHHKDKLTQLRYEMDHDTTSPKIQQMKAYIQVVKEKLKIEEKKVKDQQEQVKIAENNVQLAKEELKRKRQEVDKLTSHRKDWEKEMKKELEIIESREQDELGNTMYTVNQRRKSEFFHE